MSWARPTASARPLTSDKPDAVGIAVSSARRFRFDQGVVVHDSESGRIWFLEKELAAASSELSDADLLGLLNEQAEGTDEPQVERIGENWTAPHGAPSFDCVLAGDGVAPRVRVWGDLLAGVLRRMLAPLVIPGPPAGPTIDLFTTDDDRSAVALDGRVVQEGLGIGWWLLVRQLARSLNPDREWLGILHAATVAAPGGGAVAIAGVSGSGKTTLSGALLARGAILVSDDATPIEAGTRLAWPCPLAMGVKDGSWPVFSSLFDDFLKTEPVSVGGLSIRYYPAPRVARSGYPVAALLFPTWTPGAGHHAERLAPREALALLAKSGMLPPASGHHISELLAWLECVPAWRLTYSDHDEAASFAWQLCADAPALVSP